MKPTASSPRDAAAGTAPTSLPRGTAVGRYILVDRIGAGGMGIVYSAYDPELDRKVAVKLLRGGGESAERRGARLQREAQAMARLSHPNVVTVHDVGAYQDGIFVAMELIEGSTLSAWRRAAPRTVAEVLRAFAAAGRGLAAAHAAGLVHRDFKPDNVFVRASDGYVLVGDFGLARLAGPYDSDDGEPPSVPERPALTQAGARLGTPAYMAPEQHRGDAADARSDQFAFCVALHEALHDEHPFGGARLGGLETRDALVIDALAGRVRPPLRASRVPPALRKVILRGLLPNPEERWPSMDALLAALAHDPGRTRRRILAAIPALAVAGILGLVAVRGATRAPPCAAAAAPVAAVWSPQIHATLARAFAASGRGHAAASWSRVEQTLDAYAAGWGAMRTQACAATAVQHLQSPDLLDRRMACLDRRLGAFTALTGLLAQADGALVDRAAQAAASLPPLSACADGDALRAEVPPPADPAARRQADGLELRIATVDALVLAGKPKDAQAAIEPLVADARAAGHPVALADALFVRARILQELHDLDAARPAIEEALAAAATAHQDARAALLIADLQWVIKDRGGKADEALTLEPLAVAALHRAGDPPAERVAVLNIHGQTLESAGRYADSARVLGEAVALQERIGPRAVMMLSVRSSLSQALIDLARYDDARAELARLVELTEDRLGPRHPRMVMVLNSRGTVALYQHEYGAALADFRTALQLAEESFGPESAPAATLANNVGLMLYEIGRLDDAERFLERARALRVTLFGAEHPVVAESLDNLGNLDLARHQPGRALEQFSAALAIKARTLGAEHVELVPPLQSEAQALLDLGRADEAREAAARAVALDEKAGDARHPRLAGSRVLLAAALIRLGRAAEARSLLEAAIAVFDGREAHGPERGRARFILAQALWAAGERDAALAHAREARAIYEALGARQGIEERQALDELTAWLTHPAAGGATAAATAAARR